MPDAPHEARTLPRPRLPRVVAGNQAHQNIGVNGAQSASGGGAWISSLALVEATWVLQTVYEREPSDIAAAVEMLRNQKGLLVQDAEAATRALQSFRKHPHCFPDCLMLEIARKAGDLPLGTFDHNLARLEGAEQL